MAFDFSSMLEPDDDKKQNPLSALGDIFGGLAGGAAAGRQAQASANQGQDELRLRGLQQQFQQAAFNREAPGLRATNAVRGDILNGIQSVGTTGSGRDLQFTGGISPALLSSGTRQLGADMSRQALLSQLGKSEGSNPGGPAMNDPYTFNAPTFQPTPLPHAGFGSKLAGVLGGVGKIAGAALPFLLG